MESAFIIGSGLLCAVVVALATLAAVATRRRERHRTDHLRSWAHANGWTLTEHPAVDWGHRLPGGNPDGVHIVLSGTVRGRPVSLGEYTVADTQVTTTADATGATSTTTNSYTHHYTVSVAVLGRPLPETVVEVRGRMSRLANAAAGTGTATGNPALDRAFRIRTTHPHLIRTWATPTLIAAHLSGDVAGWSVHGTELLTHDHTRLDTAHLATKAEQIAYLAELLDAA